MKTNRFAQPWQPLKGISIKNIYVFELSYPTTTKIYQFKGVIEPGLAIKNPPNKTQKKPPKKTHLKVFFLGFIGFF
jgi:hypothetical protein